MTYRSKVAVVYLLGFFLDLINLFIASVAFHCDVRGSFAVISALWVVTVISPRMLIVPFSAFLSRYLGARRLIIFSLILFSVAPPLPQVLPIHYTALFLAYYLCGGEGGEAVLSGWSGVNGSSLNPHERAGVSSVVMMVALLAPACSPAIGGLLWWKRAAGAGYSLPRCRWPVLTLLLAYCWLNAASTTMASAKIAPSAVVDGRAAAFCHDRLSVVPGMFIGISVVGMFYLQNVARPSPCGGGSLMLLVDRFICRHYAYRTLLQSAGRVHDYRHCLLQAAGYC